MEVGALTTAGTRGILIWAVLGCAPPPPRLPAEFAGLGLYVTAGAQVGSGRIIETLGAWWWPAFYFQLLPVHGMRCWFSLFSEDQCELGKMFKQSSHLI